MKTQQSIHRRIRILILLNVITASSRIQSRFRWFRPRGNQEIKVKEQKPQYRQRTKFLKRLTMKIRIRLLRWLSLLQFPALPGRQADKLSHLALFRRPPVPKHRNNHDETLKYNLLN
jgi:hypothetical protein